MARSWIAMLSGPVVALFVVTGCGAVGPGREASSSASLTDQPSADGSSAGGSSAAGSSAGGSTPKTTPQVETSGSEKTGATEAAQAVVTPRLPIGGSSPDDQAAQQCAQASFLGQDKNSIPAGVGIVVTGAVFTKGIFAVGGDGCAGVADPPCLHGFVFTKDHNGQCAVPVRTDARRTPDENGPQDHLSLSGRLLCPDDLKAECRDLAVRLARDDQTIDLFAPLAETTSESQTSESTSETATSSATGG
jgi:hypothetical protein